MNTLVAVASRHAFQPAASIDVLKLVEEIASAPWMFSSDRGLVERGVIVRGRPRLSPFEHALTP